MWAVPFSGYNWLVVFKDFMVRHCQPWKWDDDPFTQEGRLEADRILFGASISTCSSGVLAQGQVEDVFQMVTGVL